VSFIIAWPDSVLDTMYWSEGRDGAALWSAPGTLFRKEGRVLASNLRIKHFATQGEAEAVAFNMTVYNRDLMGQIVVVECDLATCHCRDAA
jgi:hypothetical protein